MNRRQALTEHLAEGLRVYVLTDRGLARDRTEREVVEAAIAGGATAVQLRWKTGSIQEALAVGRDLRKLCRDAGVLFIVNDRVDLALALDADGVHLGEHDLPVRESRNIVGDRMLIGFSPLTLVEAVQAQRSGADYLGIGPVYQTATKADAGRPVGLDRIRDVAGAVSIPCVGIGGIDADHAAEVVASGAAGVAVISAVVGADDVQAATRALRRAVEEGLRARTQP